MAYRCGFPNCYRSLPGRGVGTAYRLWVHINHHREFVVENCETIYATVTAAAGQAAHIVDLNETIALQAGQIGNLNQTVADQAGEIACLSAKIEELKQLAETFKEDFVTFPHQSVEYAKTFIDILHSLLISGGKFKDVARTSIDQLEGLGDVAIPALRKIIPLLTTFLKQQVDKDAGLNPVIVKLAEIQDDPGLEELHDQINVLLQQAFPESENSIGKLEQNFLSVSQTLTMLMKKNDATVLNALKDLLAGILDEMSKVMTASDYNLYKKLFQSTIDQLNPTPTTATDPTPNTPNQEGSNHTARQDLQPKNPTHNNPEENALPPTTGVAATD